MGEKESLALWQCPFAAVFVSYKAVAVVYGLFSERNSATNANQK